MFTTQKDKSYCGRNINWKFVKSQEDLPKSNTKRPTYWLSTKGARGKWTNLFFHWLECKEIASSSWRCNCYHFDDCELHNKKGLVDNRSSADILYYLAFQQMRVSKELPRPMNMPIIRFGGMKVQPIGTISLPFVVSSYPWLKKKEVNFLVVECSSSYNAIIRRPTLNN